MYGLLRGLQGVWGTGEALCTWQEPGAEGQVRGRLWSELIPRVKPQGQMSLPWGTRGAAPPWAGGLEKIGVARCLPGLWGQGRAWARRPLGSGLRRGRCVCSSSKGRGSGCLWGVKLRDVAGT